MIEDALIIAILQIIAIDIVLGGDNAIIIALACRNLPARQKRLGILWGTAGAIVLRCILVFFASTLLTVPSLKLIGGLPIIITAGAALLGWLAGDLIAHDPLLKGQLATLPAYAPKVAAAGGALLVVVAGRIIAARNTGSAQHQASDQ